LWATFVFHICLSYVFLQVLSWAQTLREKRRARLELCGSPAAASTSAAAEAGAASGGSSTRVKTPSSGSSEAGRKKRDQSGQKKDQEEEEDNKIQLESPAKRSRA
jgi:hypothetical protein